MMVGDKVRVVADVGGDVKGKTGIIDECIEGGVISVKFDDPNEPHKYFVVNELVLITSTEAEPKSDPVNYPEHYTKGGIEVYDFIKAWGLDFPTGNVVKYVVRAPHKGKQLEDLKKARWYLDKLIKDAEEMHVS